LANYSIAEAATIYYCQGRVVTISGTGTIYGYGGEDWICAGQNDDPINGSKDIVKGGAGDDHIYGYDLALVNSTGYDANDGGDELYGNGGKDYIYGGKGNDTCDIPASTEAYKECEIYSN
jgi:Ca2+-binding RTX toxin-like protein